jgi:hypothetical protein
MRASGLLLSVASSIGAVASLLPTAALAHHSFAMFDMTKETTVEGTIANYQWTNPHIWVDVVAIDKATNKEEKWSFEGSGPSQLKPLGWKESDLKVGDHVVVAFHPLRSGEHGGSMTKITVNGHELKAKS